YFVFREEDGGCSFEVADFTFEHFAREEQISRNTEDEAPVPTPAWTYAENKKVSRLPKERLKKIIPTQLRLVQGKGVLELDDKYSIYYDPEFEDEAAYLANSLGDLTGGNFKIAKGPSPKERSIQLRKRTVASVSGPESYSLEISGTGVVISGSAASGV